MEGTLNPKTYNIGDNGKENGIYGNYKGYIGNM